MTRSVPLQSRRHFLRGSLALAGCGLLSGCSLLPHQLGPGRPPRIGFLAPDSPTSNSATVRLDAAFQDGLLELGYIDGQSITIDYRSAELNNDRLPALAAELVGLPVDVIVVRTLVAAQAAKRATDTIPIVLTNIPDPVAVGLVDSLAHPGGNVTGLCTLSPQLSPKRLEILRDAVSGLVRVGLLWNATSEVNAADFDQTARAAHVLGIQLQSLEVRTPDDFERAFATATTDRPGALIVFLDPLIQNQRPAVIDFAARSRLPAMYGSIAAPAEGGLMAYAQNNAALHRRAAYYVDRILKGTKPADLPIEQPTKFDFIINLKTAQTLALTIPPSVLQQATEIIQ